MQVDLVIVGGGSAGLSAAIRFQQRVEEHNSKILKTLEPTVVVLEKERKSEPIPIRALINPQPSTN